jgi:hypothetical protein
MTDREDARRVEIKDGDHTVAAAEVSQRPGGTARASLHAVSGHVAPGHRSDLVDAVVDSPEVRESSRLEATIPLGDGETLDRLRERTEETTSRPAGSTALVDASLPGNQDGRSEDQPGRPAAGDQAAGDQAAGEQAADGEAPRA